MPPQQVVPPQPPLSDGVVWLRPWRLSDVPELIECCNDHAIARWLDTIAQPYTEGDAIAYVRRTRDWWDDGSFWSFAVVGRDDRVLGSMSCGWRDERARVAEAGYWTRVEARDRGVARRALTLLAAWAFEQAGVERLQVRAEVENEASQRVAERAGFTREGVLRSSGWSARRGRRLDFVVYSLLPADLREAAAGVG